ncbi:MAG: hypothetical protein K0Q79_662 [Flavipsychrobacter sp.]|jgi:ferric-dicitrate binding protein FerR (iron transport regulator)|nr:hypothetical protein [Flavipsychrobacter sp.]
MSEQDNISPLGGGKKNLSDEKLMAYMAGKLSAAEQHEVEQWLAEEGMESDALEGLHGQDHDDTKHTINRLNHNLRQTLHNKKRKRRPANNNYTSWIAIVIILMLAVLAYLVIRKAI